MTLVSRGLVTSPEIMSRSATRLRPRAAETTSQPFCPLTVTGTHPFSCLARPASCETEKLASEAVSWWRSGSRLRCVAALRLEEEVCRPGPNNSNGMCVLVQLLIVNLL